MNRPVMRLGLALLAALALGACQQEEAPSAQGTAAVAPGPGEHDPWADRRNEGVIQLAWEDLVPPGGDSLTLYDKVSRRSLMTAENEDPFSKALLAAAHAVSSRAPVVASLNGQRVRLAGLVVPLEGDGEKMSEFLLVPYFGACIHVPPPPANQIVYVTTGKQKVDEPPLFGSVWVTGKLTTDYSSSEVGDAGYTLEAEKVEPYE